MKIIIITPILVTTFFVATLLACSKENTPANPGKGATQTTSTVHTTQTQTTQQPPTQNNINTSVTVQSFGQQVGKQLDEMMQNIKTQYNQLTAPGGALDNLIQDTKKSVTNSLQEMQQQINNQGQSTNNNANSNQQKPQNQQNQTTKPAQ